MHGVDFRHPRREDTLNTASFDPAARSQADHYAHSPLCGLWTLHSYWRCVDEGTHNNHQWIMDRPEGKVAVCEHWFCPQQRQEGITHTQKWRNTTSIGHTHTKKQHQKETQVVLDGITWWDKMCHWRVKILDIICNNWHYIFFADSAGFGGAYFCPCHWQHLRAKYNCYFIHSHYFSIDCCREVLRLICQTIVSREKILYIVSMTFWKIWLGRIH